MSGQQYSRVDYLDNLLREVCFQENLSQQSPGSRLQADFLCCLEGLAPRGGGTVTYRAGHDISRLMEMVQCASFPFEALALGSPMRNGPVTQAVGDPALPF